MPLKEFIFENMDDSNIRIIIKAPYLVDAFDQLVRTAKHFTNFKCINA